PPCCAGSRTPSSDRAPHTRGHPERREARRISRRREARKISRVRMTNSPGNRLGPYSPAVDPRRMILMRRVGGILLLVLASRTASAAPPEAAAAADPWLARPVDDQIFQTYLEFFAYDRKVPFDSRVIGNEGKDGVKREHLSFQSTRDARFFANLYRAAGSASGKPPSVVLLHGGSSAGKDDPFVPLMATLIARAGYMVLAIDMRYFAERSTDLLKTFTEQEKYE